MNLSGARELAKRTPPSRNRYVDFLRAVSIGIVVLGHWLMAAPVADRTGLSLSDVLALQPWTQWLTWAFQVMPLFFVVGGYANGASWEASQRRRDGYATWLGLRMQRLVRPVAPLLVLWCVLVAAAPAFGVRADVAGVAGHAAMIPTWFLAVYVVVVAAVPVTHRLWERFGLASVVVPLLAAATVDAVAFGSGQGWLRWANHAFIWPALHQLGYAWREHRIDGASRALAIGCASAVLLAVLVGVAGYPVSMVTVPGEETSNSRPPTLALLALGLAQFGFALSFESPARRWLVRVGPWVATMLVNRSIMTLYLWHTTALVAAIGIAQLLGSVGLHAIPGTGEWWLLRPPWLAACALALVPLVWAFSRFELAAPVDAHSLPSASRSVAGATLVCAGLASLALGGISGEGVLGLRTGAAAMALGGCALALVPRLGRPSAGRALTRRT